MIEQRSEEQMSVGRKARIWVILTWLREVLERWDRFYFTTVPTIFLFLAFGSLAWMTVNQFLNQGKFTPILTAYLTAIGIAAALASVTFGYARATISDDERKTLLSIGEFFLDGSLNLLLTLLMSWLAFEAAVLSRGLPHSVFYERTFGLVEGMALAFGANYILFAAISLYRGVIIMNRHLSPRVRSIKWPFG